METGKKEARLLQPKKPKNTESAENMVVDYVDSKDNSNESKSLSIYQGKEIDIVRNNLSK